MRHLTHREISEKRVEGGRERGGRVDQQAARFKVRFGRDRGKKQRYRERDTEKERQRETKTETERQRQKDRETELTIKILSKAG